MNIRNLWRAAARAFRQEYVPGSRKRREIESGLMRGVPEVYWFGYWTVIGVDPDGRTRMRWRWFHFNPHTGRWM